MCADKTFPLECIPCFLYPWWGGGRFWPRGLEMNGTPKHRVPPRFRKWKTSDFFGQKCRGFASKVRMFLSKKSDVFDFRFPTFSLWETTLRCSPINFFWKKFLHFLHQPSKHPVFTGSFGWRMGCRIGCRIVFPAFRGVGLPRFFVN